MKKIILILFIVLSVASLKGQAVIDFEEGKVTFLSSRNVYVRFSSTENIEPGDSLFVGQSGNLIPVLTVDNKSSSSTVCSPIGEMKLEVGDAVVAKVVSKLQQPEPKEEGSIRPIKDFVSVAEPEEEKVEVEVPHKEKIRGRISVATYNGFSSYRNSTRMRYAFLYRADYLKNSRFSVDSYVTFRHSKGEWDKVQENIGNALKVFSLSLNYRISEQSSLTIGRKINPRFSSVGAIDGIQYEQELGNFRLGAIVGSRPNYTSYGFDPTLMQYGAFISHDSGKPNTYSQTTLGFVEQRNNQTTDRRFVYFQHSGDILKDLNLFGSFELDLYEKIDNQISTTPQLTNLYLSLRYRLHKAVRFSVAYDNRRNIIYYESYKNFIDQLIDDQTRQGLRLGMNIRPYKNINLSVNANLRFQQSKANPSRNVNASLSFAKVPFIKARASLRANYLETGYLRSQVYGARLSKDFFANKLTGEIYYNWVDYQYTASNAGVNQHIGGVSLSVNLMKRLSLNMFYEGVFDAPDTYHRVNARIIKRF